MTCISHHFALLLGVGVGVGVGVHCDADVTSMLLDRQLSARRHLGGRLIYPAADDVIRDRRVSMATVMLICFSYEYRIQPDVAFYHTE